MRRSYKGIGPSKDEKMAAWIRAYERHPDVVAWLAANPPPPQWQGTPMEWVYTEMPTMLTAPPPHAES